MIEFITVLLITAKGPANNPTILRASAILSMTDNSNSNCSLLLSTGLIVSTAEDCEKIAAKLGVKK